MNTFLVFVFCFWLFGFSFLFLVSRLLDGCVQNIDYDTASSLVCRRTLYKLLVETATQSTTASKVMVVAVSPPAFTATGDQLQPVWLGAGLGWRTRVGYF